MMYNPSQTIDNSIIKHKSHGTYVYSLLQQNKFLFGNITEFIHILYSRQDEVVGLILYNLSKHYGKDDSAVWFLYYMN